MKFEWDEGKAAANLRKHGISFTEASTVFADELSLTGDDPGSFARRMPSHHFWRIIHGPLAGCFTCGALRPYPHHQRKTRDTKRKEVL